MSDFITVKLMLQKANIPFTAVEGGAKVKYEDKIACSTIIIQNSPTIGYSMFFGCWLFDEQGQLLAVGHYE